MISTSFAIPGFSEDDKVPGFVAQTVYGAGAISNASIPLILLICGLKLTGWSTGLTPDVDVSVIQSVTDADAAWGPGSEGALMAYAALQIPGVTIKGCAPTPGASAAAATATITIVATPTTTGTWNYRIDGFPISGGTTTADTETTIATAIKNAILAQPRMACTATSSAGVVTLTWNSVGPRGNFGIVYQQKNLLAAGVTSTLAGGAALLSSTGGENGVYFTGGTTAENVTNMLATLFPARYHRIAFAQTDATNLAKWVTQANNKAGPLEGRMEHLVGAVNGSVAASESLASATINNWRFMLNELLNSETHPSELAATIAALRIQAEQQTPNSGFDGVVVPGAAPQCSRADWAQRATQKAMLNSGVTPLVTNEQGQVLIVRAITTHCLSGSTPDFRTLDTAAAVVPDFVRDDLNVYWTTGFAKANQYVRDDPAPGEKDPPQGVANPTRWNAAMNGRLLTHQLNNILTEVELNPPTTEFDDVAFRLMSLVPSIPLPLNHQVGVSVLGLQAA